MFLNLTLVLASAFGAMACGAHFGPSLHHMRAKVKDVNLMKRQTVKQELPTDQNKVKHWTVDQNRRQMQVSDDAFIARDLAHFNHHENSTMYYTGGVFMNLTQHLEDMRLLYSIYSDGAPHNHDYRISFGEGDWTVVLAQVSGTQDGPLPSLQGTLLPPTNKKIHMDLMTIARWNNGWMMEEYLWSDNPFMYRQVGVLPDRPNDNLPDLELNLATPLSTKPGEDHVALNKKSAKEADDALNDGKLTIESLNLDHNALIYGLSDIPMNVTGYIDWLEQFKSAFSDLHLENRPYKQIIGQGDWTATVSMLSGTHDGNLTLPTYLSEKPILSTGKKFDLLHCTIARWQNGKIVGLRVNIDYFGIVAAFGIEI
ncbi:hypothetical protein FSHL1_006766 [Fusarium sambucinum]